MTAPTFKITCTVEVEIPCNDLWPYDGSLTAEEYAKNIKEHPSGNLLDFAQYDQTLKITSVTVTPQTGH